MNYLKAADQGIHIKSLCHNDVIRQHGSGSTLPQLMAYCLMAPGNYLGWCWLIISEVLWHSHESNLTVSAQATSLYNGVEIILLISLPQLPGASELKRYNFINMLTNVLGVNLVLLKSNSFDMFSEWVVHYWHVACLWDWSMGYLWADRPQVLALNSSYPSYYSDVTWVSHHLKALQSQLFVQQLVQVDNKNDWNPTLHALCEGIHWWLGITFSCQPHRMGHRQHHNLKMDMDDKYRNDLSLTMHQSKKCMQDLSLKIKVMLYDFLHVSLIFCNHNKLHAYFIVWANKVM